MGRRGCGGAQGLPAGWELASEGTWAGIWAEQGRAVLQWTTHAAPLDSAADEAQRQSFGPCTPLLTHL